jgi:subtilisin family serine protease
MESGGTAESHVSESEAADADVLVFRKLGIGILSGAQDHLKRVSELVSTSHASPIVTVTREKVVRTLQSAGAAVPVPSSGVGWWLNAARVTTSPFSGKGVKIAIADTGLDLNHPDFANRVTDTYSAIPGATPQDMAGHGTQCAGIAAGPTVPSSAQRYGIAGNCNIAVAKVISDSGIGAQGWVVAGCEWALTRGCRIICLAMEDAVSPGEPADPVYEKLGKQCLDNRTLLIAAAGNDSHRAMGDLRPVSSPANCVSIMGVGAVGMYNSQLQVAPFSNAGGNGPGSDVDIAAPGVSIASACPLPVKYTTGSGTSQAAAFVSGIAALVLEKNPALNAIELWQFLCQTAQKLPFASSDVGAGLVQAPQ